MPATLTCLVYKRIDDGKVKYTFLGLHKLPSHRYVKRIEPKFTRLVPCA